MMVSVVVLASVLALMRRLHNPGWKGFSKIAGCGIILALHWVAFFASIQASNVSISVACVATSCFFTTLFHPLINRKRISWIEVLILPIYTIIDMVETAENVWSDSCVCAMTDKDLRLTAD